MSRNGIPPLSGASRTTAIWLETTGGNLPQPEHLLWDLSHYFGVNASDVRRLLAAADESGSYTGDEDSEESDESGSYTGDEDSEESGSYTGDEDSKESDESGSYTGDEDSEESGSYTRDEDSEESDGDEDSEESDESGSDIHRFRERPEIERPFKCEWEGCDKAYGRLWNLNKHVTKERHGARRTTKCKNQRGLMQAIASVD
ncbi:hypothetical protein FN846DRAFT_911899 [Sphaerosporella brunnea]|uniref:C2H2-type domain-containing protein n=1 Tax=Sphaerosporella brunnea TaxID=1250544 RepID=A0A5J5EJI6_9PEZI|nr:hypothetical protein FN846DRAFT_911899 [Sphaerosporella brunnea]